MTNTVTGLLCLW